MRLAASVRRFAILAACLAPAALAPAARAADADQVRADVTAVLDEVFAVGPEKGIAYEGIDIQGDAAPFDVAIRGIKLGTSVEGYADVGTVTFKVAPAGEGLYDVSDLKLPASISHTAPEDALEDAGEVDATIEIGEQSFNGLWSMPMRSFISFDGSIASIRGLDGDGAEILTVGPIKLDGDSTETSPGRWDQEGTATISNLKIAPPDEEDTVTIAELSVGTQARGIDVATFDELMKTMEAAGLAAQSEWQQPGEDATTEGLGDAPVAPADDTMAPADDTMAPADDATAPADDTMAPADDTTDAGAEVAADPNASADQASGEAVAEAPLADEPLADEPMSDTPEAEELGAPMPEPSPDDMMMPPSDMPSDALSPEQAKALQDMMEAMQGIPGAIGDASSNIVLRGLVVQGAGGAEKFRLDSASLQFGATDLDKDKSGLRFAYNHTGLDADWNIFASDDDGFESFEEMEGTEDGSQESLEEAPAPEPLDAETANLVDQLAPREFAIDIQLADVPSKELWNTFVSTFYSSAASGGPSEMEMGMMGMMLPMMLAQAGSTVRIVDTYIVANAARVGIDGSVKADSASMMGASGTVTVEITGLDAVIDLVKNYVGPEGADDTAPLEMLRAFGERTQADGTTVDRYLVTLEPNGALLVNGKDMNFLLGMGEPPPQ